MKPFAETNCVFEHEGKSFAANGAWLTPEGGAVYVINRDGHWTIETWKGDLISANVSIVSEWTCYSRNGYPYRMRSIRFSVQGNIHFTGRYGSDWAQLCKVKRVK